MAPSLQIPDWLKYKKGQNERSKVFFLDIQGQNIDLNNYETQKRINRLLKDMLASANCGRNLTEPALIKCHIGEPRCTTRMIPVFALSSIEFLREGGVDRIAAGDSTTLYSGPRGHSENAPTEFSLYLSLAESHGWCGPSGIGVPFVILDRPASSIPRTFEFENEEIIAKGEGNYKEIYLSGGFKAAGTIINHVHLTGHTLVHVALCVKGLTMGLASRRGKLQMHQYLQPEIDAESCTKCGKCAKGCPENALIWEKGEVPRLDSDRCIGCGQCASICATVSNSITVRGLEITDWTKGKVTFQFRLVDFLVGALRDRWDDVTNIAHMYRITALCDCVDSPQKPMTSDIGFIVGKNPFAVDYLASELLNASVMAEWCLSAQSKAIYSYAQNTYGFVVEPEVETIAFKK